MSASDGSGHHLGLMRSSGSSGWHMPGKAAQQREEERAGIDRMMRDLCAAASHLTHSWPHEPEEARRCRWRRRWRPRAACPTASQGVKTQIIGGPYPPCGRFGPTLHRHNSSPFHFQTIRKPLQTSSFARSVSLNKQLVMKRPPWQCFKIDEHGLYLSLLRSGHGCAASSIRHDGARN